jgi:signal peptidase
LNETLKTTLKIINYMIVSIVLILAFLMVGIKIFGFQIYTVLSGSMEPNYHVGSLVYIKETEQKE